MISKREFIVLQARAFIDYASKPGAQSFDDWARSKDLNEEEKETIRAVVKSLVLKREPIIPIAAKQEVTEEVLVKIETTVRYCLGL
jgi:hypothetical protein